MEARGHGVTAKRRKQEARGHGVTAKRRKQEARGHRVTAPPVTETNLRLMGSRNSEQKLLPGIPDDITLSMITPKLSWSNFNNLYSVSRGWEKAIQTQLVYKERVRSHSTDTLVVILDKGPKIDIDDERSHLHEVAKLSLYSMRDKTWCELPRIPNFTGYHSTGVPRRCQCIALEGKIFVFPGGGSQRKGRNKKVYMLDLAAGERNWKQCASMLQQRDKFGLAVMDGKIYAFGGLGLWEDSKTGCEVYDSKTDRWSCIKPMTYFYYGHRVATIGEELFMYDQEKLHVPARVNPKVSSFGEVYHPSKDEWRLIDQFERNLPEGIIFAAQGKFYVIGNEGCDIYVLDMDIQSSTLLQSSSFPDIGVNYIVFADSVLVVDDELVLLVTVFDMEGYCDSPLNLSGYIPRIGPSGYFGVLEKLHSVDMDHATMEGRPRGVRLVTSRGFGQGSKGIVWETITCPHEAKQCVDLENRSLMCSVRL